MFRLCDPPGDLPCPNCGTLLWFTKTPDGFWFWEVAEVAKFREEILERICANLGVAKDERIDIYTYVESLGGDSLDIVEVFMEIEEEFELTIPHHDMVHIRTLRELVDYLLRRKLL